MSRLEDTSDPMTMSYDYKREKSGDRDNLKIIAQLAPVELPQVDEKEPPVQAIALGVPRVETSTSAMKLPEGWGGNCLRRCMRGRPMRHMTRPTGLKKAQCIRNGGLRC